MAGKETRLGPLFKKKKTVKNYYVSIRIWIVEAIHMLKGLNIDADFGQRVQQQKKPNNIEKVEKGK